MSTYVFKAMDLAGVKARGEIDADSKEAVSNQLKSRGMIVLDIADKHASREIELSFMKSVKAGELAVFSRQLATMISSGLSILRALYVLEEQTENKFLKETVVQVRKDVEAGLSLSGAMEAHPKVFNPLFVAMTRAGEAGGLLEGSLMQVADQLEKEASLRRQIRSAMIYPVLVITFAVAVMMALVAFLVPVFVGGEHIFTSSAKAHQADCGNAEPSTYVTYVEDVYAEGGLMFPCVKVQEDYKDVEDVIRMCRRRIRVPEVWYGDYLATMGAARSTKRPSFQSVSAITTPAARRVRPCWMKFTRPLVAASRIRPAS